MAYIVISNMFKNSHLFIGESKNEFTFIDVRSRCRNGKTWVRMFPKVTSAGFITPPHPIKWLPVIMTWPLPRPGVIILWPAVILLLGVGVEKFYYITGVVLWTAILDNYSVVTTIVPFKSSPPQPNFFEICSSNLATNSIEYARKTVLKHAFHIKKNPFLFNYFLAFNFVSIMSFHQPLIRFFPFSFVSHSLPHY